MSAEDLFTTLRTLIAESERTLANIANKADVPYHKLYRFVKSGGDLSVADADAVYKKLTGKSFIVIPDASK